MIVGHEYKMFTSKAGRQLDSVTNNYLCDSNNS